MGKRIITVTHPDGTKKVLVGKESNEKPVKSREINNDRPNDDNKENNGRAKPIISKAGITKSRVPYKKGGKLYVK